MQHNKPDPQTQARHVLVTGGAGYVGAHVCHALAQAGHVPVAFDDFSQGHAPLARFGPVVRASLQQPEALAQTFARWPIDAVVHCAAIANVPASHRAPQQTYAVNVAQALALLKAMGDAHVTDIVFSSSCAVYGPPQQLPLVESHPQQPISPYGRSKAMFEAILQDAAAAGELRAVALRYFNAAGAADQAGLYEQHVPETHLIPLALLAAHGGKPLQVYGRDYATEDGTCVRDYVHVADLARAHVAALATLRQAPMGYFLPINLGTGRGYSILQIIAAAERAVGKRIATTDAPRRPGDPAILVAEAKRARDILGWQPQHSALQDIVDSAWRALAPLQAAAAVHTPRRQTRPARLTAATAGSGRHRPSDLSDRG